MTLSLPKRSNFSYEKTYFYLLIMLAISIPLSRAGISFSILALMLTWLIQRDYKRKIIILSCIPYFKTMSLFFLFMGFSLLWSASLQEGLHYMRLYSYWFVLVVIASSLEKKYIPYIINAFIIAMFISEVLTYGVYFELWSIKGATRAEPTIFMIRIDYSVLLAVTVILLLNRIFIHQSHLKTKLISIFFLFMVLGNLLITNGRTGLAALISAMFVLLIIHFRHSIKKLIITFITFFLILVAAYFLVNNFHNRVNDTISDFKSISQKHYATSIGTRLSYWPITKDIFLENPIFGTGIGGALTASHEKYLLNEYGFAQSVIDFTHNMHYFNIFLQTLAQLGIIGLILILVIIYQLLTLKINNKEMKIFSLLFTIIFFVGSMTEPLWYKQTTIAIYILFVGIFLRLSLEDKEA